MESGDKKINQAGTGQCELEDSRNSLGACIELMTSSLRLYFIDTLNLSPS